MYLLFDIGATKTRLGVSLDGKEVSQNKISPTPEKFDDAMAVFETLTCELIRGKSIEKSAGGIRGVLNKEKDSLEKDTLLGDWVGKPLGKKISEITGSEVFLENDTAMCGLGEANYGAGINFGIVAYLTVSSGVGGVRIVKGEIDENFLGFEPGHQIIDVDASIFPQSEKEFLELEDCVSGRALESRYNKDPRDIKEISAWKEIEKLLSIGITNTILHWTPNVVVLGGGVAQDDQMSIDRIRGYIEKYLKVFPQKPEIKKGELKDLAGLYGSLFRLRQI
jgi:predicted NBD/HSP70 family sugar kinase